MRFVGDRRGQSVVIGTVILFGFLIVAMAVYQAQVVPQDNADVEFEHSQSVEGDFVDLRNAITGAGTVGDGRSTSVQLGTRYPQRTFFVNPPPATGELSTSDRRTLRIDNVTVDAEDNVGEYWENRLEETDGAIEYETRSLRYSPDYNEFRNGPDLVYEHSLVAAEFDDAALGRTGQTAVNTDRNRIGLTVLDGELNARGVERESVDPETLSENRRSIPVESDGGDSIVVELPTNLDEERADDYANVWRDRLGVAGEDVTVADDAVRIDLGSDDDYRLNLAKVGVGSEATTPEPAYITRVSGTGGAVAEVRDEFNNPIEGVDVEVEVNGEPVDNVTTDADGRAEFEPTGARPRVDMSIGDEEWESIRFRSVSGGPGGGGGGGGVVNPGEDNDIVLDDAGIGEDNDVVDLRFHNEGDEDRSFEMAQLTLYYSPGMPGETQDELTIRDTGQDISLRGPFQDLDESFTIPSGGTATMTFEFDGDARGDLLGVSFVTDENEQVLYLSGMEGELEDQPPFFNVGIDDTNSPIEAGGSLDVDATVENTGDEVDTQTIELEIDGDIEDETEITLGEGESEPVTLEWQTVEGDAGEYTATVRSDDNSDSVEVQVVEEGEPITGSFSGTVVDNEDEAVEEEVTFEDADGEVLGTDTPDAGDGFYTIEDVEGGTYDITASADGLVGTVDNVEINPGEETEDVDFTLVEDESSGESVEWVPNSGQTFWGSDGVQFELENTGAESATITEFTIDSTSSEQVVEVSESQTGSYNQGQHEVYIDSSTDGVLEMDGEPYWEDDGTPLPIGSTEPMTESAILDPSTTGTVYIYAFRNNGGNIVDMSGETITITLGFDDGSSATYTIEID